MTIRFIFAFVTLLVGGLVGALVGRAHAAPLVTVALEPTSASCETQLGGVPEAVLPVTLVPVQELQVLSTSFGPCHVYRRETQNAAYDPAGVQAFLSWEPARRGRVLQSLHDEPQLTSYRCHGYSLVRAGIPELRKGFDVQEGLEPGSETPLRWLLHEHFQVVTFFGLGGRHNQSMARVVEKDADLHEGDWLGFRESRGLFIHSGLLRAVGEGVDRQWWLESKLGIHDVVLAPIGNFLSAFPDTSEIVVYRRKN